MYYYSSNLISFFLIYNVITSNFLQQIKSIQVNASTRRNAGVYVLYISPCDHKSTVYPAKDAATPKPIVPHTRCLPYPICLPSPEK